MKNVLLQSNHRYSIYDSMKKPPTTLFDYILFNESSNQQTNLFTLVPKDLYSDEAFPSIWTIAKVGLIEKDTPFSLEAMDDTINLSTSKLYTRIGLISEWNKIRQIENCMYYPYKEEDASLEILQYIVKGKSIWDYSSCKLLSNTFLENVSDIFGEDLFSLKEKFTRAQRSDKKYIIFTKLHNNDIWEFADHIPMVFDHVGIRLDNSSEYYLLTYEQYKAITDIDYVNCVTEYFKMENGKIDYDNSIDIDTVVMTTVDSYLKFAYHLPLFYLYDLLIGMKYQKTLILNNDFSHKNDWSSIVYSFTPAKDKSINTKDFLSMLTSSIIL